MAARKLAQEVDKCFKKVAEGVAEFEAIYDKIEQSNNPAQKDKLEDNLKREIKKLQRLRDQIKTWAASNDIKDKAPLLEHRRLIETQMEKFKAVEKAMKTKAYSKEGLSAAAKLDPKEQAKMEASEFLNSMVDELEQQVETLEAEAETIQATMKKGKNNSAKTDRMAEIERIIERHKWHQGKLELIRRSLENGGVETEQVNDLEESIRYYVSDGMNDDFMEDDTMYDDLNLQEEEDAFGMNLDNDKVSSQDTQSIQEETVAEAVEASAAAGPAAAATASARATGKQRAVPDSVTSTARRPSAHMKSPLPTLAMGHSSTQPNASNSVAMKPASVPARPVEGLKYASAAAAAAAANDKNHFGIAPLPPPPPANATFHPTSGVAQFHNRPSASNSPNLASAQLATQHHAPAPTEKPPPTAAAPPAAKSAPTTAAPTPSNARPSSLLSKASGAAVEPWPTSTPPTHTATAAPISSRVALRGKTPVVQDRAKASAKMTSGGRANGISYGSSAVTTQARAEEAATEAEESIYHLPASLQDLVESYEVTESGPSLSAEARERLHVMSQGCTPDITDAETPRKPVPDTRIMSASQYPREPLAIFENPQLYSRCDSDTLFYAFYYQQGTYQQYLAARTLKDQSWRFHKQYQTWFQRHEEPKSITEEHEQGTYRFFDYESTWMNRRKADFKFAYKYLEDEV